MDPTTWATTISVPQSSTRLVAFALATRAQQTGGGWVVRGCTQRELAAACSLTEPTVRTHLLLLAESGHLHIRRLGGPSAGLEYRLITEEG